MAESARLAYKAYEIEEFVDVYFFRRLGYVVACAARVARLTPNAVSVLAGLVGAVGGALFFEPRLAPAGFALLVLHGVVDSADGQLARMTGRTSELGRMLDGLAGYVTHAAMYVAIVAGVVARGGSWSILGWACLAGVFTAIQAQMYDYHRTTYAQVVIRGVAGRRSAGAALTDRGSDGSAIGIVRAYEAMQRRLAGAHVAVEAAIAARSVGGQVRPDDRERYRAAFYRRVRGWNLLGDNGRRGGAGVLVLIGQVEWFFAFILLPLNAVLAVLWLWQQRADRRFLAEIGAPDRPR